MLISPRRAGEKRLIAVLQPLIGKIDVAAMQAANYSVDRDRDRDRDRDKASPAEAARAWR